MAFFDQREREMHQRNAVEKVLEAILFKSRWLLAPFYLGLVLSLVLLLGAFLAELIHFMPQLLDLAHIDPEQVILAVLSLIDLSLAGNLVVIVIFSGYENFVSKINTENAEDRPSWMGTLDFSGLKMKLIGSIVAISRHLAAARLHDPDRKKAASLDERKLSLDADPAPDICGFRPDVRGYGLHRQPRREAERTLRRRQPRNKKGARKGAFFFAIKALITSQQPRRRQWPAPPSGRWRGQRPPPGPGSPW